jgi:DNA-binding response OmpR family regulator
MRRSTAERQGAAQSTMEEQLRRPVVLVIEDDIDLRRLYAEELERAGYDVREAHNGLQAMEKASEVVPEAIVTDLGLPGIDGYELCRRIHRDARLERIPIIAITGRYFSEEDLDRARKAGCQAVLIKPFEADDLIAEVRKALSPEPSSLSEPSAS